MRKLLIGISITAALMSCSKWDASRSTDCPGISSPSYSGTWQYVQIQNPGDPWEILSDGCEISFNPGAMDLNFYPFTCNTTDYGCGSFSTDINPGVVFSSLAAGDTLYLLNPSTGVNWKLLKI